MVRKPRLALLVKVAVRVESIPAPLVVALVVIQDKVAAVQDAEAVVMALRVVVELVARVVKALCEMAVLVEEFISALEVA